MSEPISSDIEDAETRLTKLRHALRNDLATALLAADILSGNGDATVQKHAKIIMTALEAATDRIRKTRKAAG